MNVIRFWFRPKGFLLRGQFASWLASPQLKRSLSSTCQSCALFFLDSEFRGNSTCVGIRQLIWLNAFTRLVANVAFHLRRMKILKMAEIVANGKPFFTTTGATPTQGQKLSQGEMLLQRRLTAAKRLKMVKRRKIKLFWRSVEESEESVLVSDNLFGSTHLLMPFVANVVLRLKRMKILKKAEIVVNGKPFFTIIRAMPTQRQKLSQGEMLLQRRLTIPKRLRIVKRRKIKLFWRHADEDLEEVVVNV